MINVFGTSIRFHPLFVLVMLVSVFTGYWVELLTLFAVVLIHELGHAAAADRLGWRIRQIELLPFGGVVKLDEWGPVSARNELIVALAGPLQNGWMIGLSWLLSELNVWSSDWSDYFMQANLIIALFNLLPVLPLDGGKIMQALVSCVLPYYRTLAVCGLFSSAASVGMILFACARLGDGLQLNLLLVGCFLVVSNWYEYRHRMYHFLRFLLNRKWATPEGSTLPAVPIVVAENNDIAHVVRLLRRNKYQWIFVTDHRGRVRTVLPETELIRRYLQNKLPEEKP